jgi:hypothetical protein
MPTKLIRTFTEKLPLPLTKPELAVKLNLTIADGLGRRRSRTPAAGTGFANNSNTGQVVDASVFVAGDVLQLEDGAAIGTVQSVDVTTTPDTVVLTGNAANNVAVGDAVLASDGSQVAKGIADDADDGDGKTPIGVYVAGVLDQSKLNGLDASAKVEMGGASMTGGAFKF